MDGIETLDRLSDKVKLNLEQEYGSLAELYRHIISISHNEKIAYQTRDQIAISNCEKELLDIEDKLEVLGVSDGRDITTAITSDYVALIAKNTIENLNVHLTKYGTDFETMRELLRKIGA